ncbi:MULTISPECIES: HAD family hydrolase [Bacillota]|jgi:phosphoglycolate phosphatase|uniref:HAD family hydrolase n=2 Tax=Amedibacillus TaxID=2749846 RepID=A0A7G9GIY9_9FIRM|nr:MULTISPECIES: HAD family hydrolase [Bacillota]QNM10771.1 HAD family hydrolase [[Eubacterium] hominis]MCH4285739.1 HAD family hydrolase [Amedibacillus hominis]RGB53922.1 HAD family hydrolase [Absiella sp. AM22-9]RGB61318.1 HAD family hydrolase [Absiella sp. AM10-20]RGB64214.1 HAD family hydrolase [Absiella sp. AM09-45]
MISKNLIFDIDGTLWDATHQICEAYNEIITKENKNYPLITDDMMAGVMGLLIPDIADQFFPYLSKSERLTFIQKCCDNENNHLKTHGGILYPNVKEVLSQLSKTYNLFIVSNCQDGYIDALFTAHPIGQYFKDSECSGRTSLPKGKNIRLLMERNNLKDAIYIGDTQKDKEACEDAQIPFIYATYGFGTVDSYDAKIDSFDELLTLFSN